MPLVRYEPPARQIVMYGDPVSQMLPKALSELWSRQTILVTNMTSAAAESYVQSFQEILSDAYSERLSDRADRSAVLSVTGALRHAGTEAMVAAGSGAAIETAKAARVCLTNNVAVPEDFERLRKSTTAASPRPYLIAIPTTLSGEEYLPFAVIEDKETGGLQPVQHTDLAPDIVLLDPHATLTTPESEWLASGMASVVNAIETGGNTLGERPLAKAAALHGLSLLTKGLRRSRTHPLDTDARLMCQKGAWLATQGLAQGALPGPCHRIGRVLSSVTGLPRGLVSAVILPHVLRQSGGTAESQAELVAAMELSDNPLDQVVAELLLDLGLPSSLSDCGVESEALSDAIDFFSEPENAGDFAQRPSADFVNAVLDAAY